MAKRLRSKTKERVNKLYTVSEAAELVGLDSPQILYRIKTGKIKAEKVGWMWVIDKEELDRYIEELEQEEE